MIFCQFLPRFSAAQLLVILCVFLQISLDICRHICYPVTSCEKYEKYDWRDLSLASGKHVLGMNKTRHIFGTAKVGDRGQIVIPKDARELYGIRPGDTLLILGDEENGMIVTKPEVLSNLAAKILDQIGNEK